MRALGRLRDKAAEGWLQFEDMNKTSPTSDRKRVKGILCSLDLASFEAPANLYLGEHSCTLSS